MRQRKIKDPKAKSNKSKSIRISLSARANLLARKTSDKSKFINKSISGMSALSEVIAELQTKDISVDAAIVRIQDLADIWESEFEESEDYNPNKGV